MSSPSIPPTPARNITTEYEQTLAGMQATAPGRYALESQYGNLYNQLDLRNLAQSIMGYTDESGVRHPGQLQLGQESATSTRGADIRDVERLGPRASAAFLAANPLLRTSLEGLSRRSVDSPILRTLNRQAEGELALNGELSSQDRRAADNATRAGFADRGTLFGNASLGAEILGRDALTRQRRGEGRQFGETVQGLNQQQNDFAGRVAQIYGSALSDPFMAILGRSSGSGGGGAGGGGGMIGTGARMFDPNNAYAEDIYNTNFNASASRNIAEANRVAGQNASYIGAGSAIAAAAISAIAV